MYTPSGSVAVLLFSLSARQEAQRKPLAGSVGRSVRVWQSLEKLAFSKIQASGLPGFVSHELVPECSGTFGQQLYRATQAVLDLGYESVVCIGNDSPSLRPAELCEAARVLQSGAIPVGIDKRGGAYLVGVSRASLADEQAFTSLPWQTTSLAQSLLDFSHRQVQETVVQLASHVDWNTRTDICVDQLVGQRTWLHRIVEALFLPEPVRLSVRRYVFPAQSIAPSGLRAPPSLN